MAEMGHPRRSEGAGEMSGCLLIASGLRPSEIDVADLVAKVIGDWRSDLDAILQVADSTEDQRGPEMNRSPTE
jgi:hypothetical protein